MEQHGMVMFFILETTHNGTPPANLSILFIILKIQTGIPLLCQKQMVI